MRKQSATQVPSSILQTLTLCGRSHILLQFLWIIILNLIALWVKNSRGPGVHMVPNWCEQDDQGIEKMSLNYELCNRAVGHSDLQAFGLCDKFQPLKFSQPNKDPGPGPTSLYFSCHNTQRWLLLFALTQGSWTADFWRETMPALGTVSKCTWSEVSHLK